MTTFMSIFKKNKILHMAKNSVITLPTPVSISYMWNFGSILGLFFLIQIISGLLLSLHYCPNINLAFNSIIHIMKNVNLGWLMRLIHMNGASFFFLAMYIHMARGMYFFSFNLKKVWTIGVAIYLMSMATAFLGYVLPWGQMSFWGATVITNLLSAIPYIGNTLVEWIWGGFSINNATLNRFYTFHIYLPIFLSLLILAHLFFLHEKFSNNMLGTNSKLYMIPFTPYFLLKDLYGYSLILTLFFIILMKFPYLLGDPDNFILANPMVTPEHIKPEWYFLFAYAILRSIPSKLGGVSLLLSSILILLTLPLSSVSKMSSCKFYYMNKMMYWIYIMSFSMLTWLGAQEIASPYMELTQMFSLIYFTYFFLITPMNYLWDKLLWY